MNYSLSLLLILIVLGLFLIVINLAADIMIKRMTKAKKLKKAR